jgi:hypothetical protein
MMRYRFFLAVLLTTLLALPAAADTFFFSTGNPDGRIATLSTPAGAGHIQTETADDFILSQFTQLTSATFVGLIPLGTSLSSISQVEVEFYNVFPIDSDTGRTSGPPTFSTSQVPTRVNSPSDVEISTATRDSAAGGLSFSTGLLSSNFTVANTVVTGVNPVPGQTTGGEGPYTGQEVEFNVTFTTPVDLAASHYFFRPEVQVDGGMFLWLSAPRPIGADGTPFLPDLQTWIRNDNLAPDWLRVGTDITQQGPFNATFSLSGTTTTPEPSSWTLLAGALAVLLLRKHLPRLRAVTSRV